MNSIFRTKPINELLEEATGNQSLKKVLGTFELTMLGVGAIIGTGIFVLTGVAAAKFSGPALVLSFILAFFACATAALCYAEFAAMVPVSGSAYTYGYVALGEIWAWIIGWDLILEYALAISLVAIGWSGYIVNLLYSVGINLPAKFTNAYGVNGGLINLPAIGIIVIISLLNIIGVKQSTKLNNFMVIVKISIVFLFIILGVTHINTSNWKPFLPFGWSGVLKGAGVVFTAYIGFDAVSTAAEEVKNPQKDLPRGIIFSLVICTLLYMVVAGILTGIVKYNLLDNPAPVAYALKTIGINWGSALVAVGAIFGITSVLLVLVFAQSRIFFAMSRDGLLPKVCGEVSPKYGTPAKSIGLTCIATSLIAGFTPIGAAAELTNIGTLAAFIIVSLAVIVLRHKRPDIKRTFKTPFVPVVPALAVISCSILIIGLPAPAKIGFFIWLCVGLVIYFLFGRKNSVISEKKKVS